MADLPRVAIVGSADRSRTDYTPDLQNAADATHACEALGAELAERGWGLIVYSGEPAYVEADVVRGYVASGKARPRSIQVWYPHARGAKALVFAELQTHEGVFDHHPQPHGSWEVPFYTSLKTAAAIVVIGGGRSSLIAGLLAQIRRIPLLAVAAFGGGAQTVWTLGAGGLASEDERDFMGRAAWGDGSAAQLVKILGDQRKRLEAEERDRQRTAGVEQRRMRNRGFVTGGLILGAALLAAGGAMSLLGWSARFALLFFAMPLVTGAAGGLARTIVNIRRRGEPRPGHEAVTSAVLGMTAGFMAGLLFAAAHLVTTIESDVVAAGVPPRLIVLVVILAVIGFAAGLSLEAVFRQLQRLDLVDRAALEARVKMQGHART